MINMENNPTANNTKIKSAVEIVRIAPRNQGIEIEFCNTNGYRPYSKLVICEAETGAVVCERDILGSDKVFNVDGLLNHIDYTAEVVIFDYNGKELHRSPKRLFRTGYFPGHVINYLHPNDLTYCSSGRFLGSPNIIRLENGTYIASHDVFGQNGHEALCLFFVSKDYGKNWSYLSKIERCAWGNLFCRKDKIYILGITASAEGDLVLYCSEDDGLTWSKPTILFKHQKEFSVRLSPTAYAETNGRLWFYFNNFTYNDPAGFQTAVASVTADSDYMDCKNWVMTPFLKFDSNWEGIDHKAWGPYMWEEGNLLINRENELIMILRYNSHRYDIPESDPKRMKAIILKVDADNPGAPLQFKKVIPFNGTLSKFYIRYDEKSDLYYAMLNRMTTNKIWQRNVLSLYSSHNLETWKVERDLINLEDGEWPESNWESGVQYPTWFMEGNDIVAAVRTAMNGADNFHNSNAITCHRFKEFREIYQF